MDRTLREAAFFLFSGACCAFGQSADGKLTVTATVLTSVSLVIDADGTQRIVIANASDPGDNVSTLLLATPNQLNARTGDRSTPKRSKPATFQQAGIVSPKQRLTAEPTTLYQHSVQGREH